MASVKKYNLAGVNANVELGKAGPHIVGSAGAVTFETNAGSNASIEIADGTIATHAVTKGQLDSSLDYKIKLLSQTVNYNDGNVSLGTALANTQIHSVVIDPSTTWTSANSSTNITVGDDGDVDRLFAVFDYDVQTKDETDYKYTANTELKVYVTQGAAGAGTAKVTVTYTSPGLIS